MNFVRKHKNKIIIVLLVLCVLTLAFLSGEKKTDEQPQNTATVKPEAEIGAAKEEQPPVCPPPEKTSEPEKGGNVTEKAAEEVALPEKTYNPAADTAASAPEEKEPDEEKNVCTFSVSCQTALKNNSGLSDEKRKILPKDGIILTSREVEFFDGETVFNVLRRETKKNKIHMEFVNTPVYGTAYIEGIGNLYEFDCGELSGWMFKVNGVFPSCGSSRVTVNRGDVIEWVYTCDLGADIGGQGGGFQKDE